MLSRLDTSVHNVGAFSSGVAVCDHYLLEQAKKAVPSALVWAEGSTIIGFSRYKIVQSGSGKVIFPCVMLEYVARDLTFQGAGSDLMLRTFASIALDGRYRDKKGILIDSLNCGDPARCMSRWKFFTEKIGFEPLTSDGNPFGYAFLPMSTVQSLAARWAQREAGPEAPTAANK